MWSPSTGGRLQPATAVPLGWACPLSGLEQGYSRKLLFPMRPISLILIFLGVTVFECVITRMTACITYSFSWTLAIHNVKSIAAVEIIRSIFFNATYVPSTVPCFLHTFSFNLYSNPDNSESWHWVLTICQACVSSLCHLSHQILVIALGSEYNSYPHFTEEKTTSSNLLKIIFIRWQSQDMWQK